MSEIWSDLEGILPLLWTGAGFPVRYVLSARLLHLVLSAFTLLHCIITPLDRMLVTQTTRH